MNTLELQTALEEIEHQIKIVPTPDAGIRAVLRERLANLDVAGIKRAHSYVAATVAENVALNVEMIAGFIGADLSQITETA